jgi:hypothetical protein
MSAIRGPRPQSVRNKILDIYPNATVAYSLRKLRTAYTGSAIRVRRSNDNTELNIGFDGDILDITSLLNFCGVSDGFITTWYDQSGNANNATQSTTANQCQIVGGGAGPGSIVLDIDTNKITTSWTNDRYLLTSGITSNTQYLSISMFRRNSTSENLHHLGNTADVTPSTLAWLNASNSCSVRSRMSTLLSFDLIFTLGRCTMTSLKDSLNLKVAYRNGVQLTNTATEAPAVGTLNVFGQGGGSTTTGQYQEYIYWGSDQSNNRIGIENNINTFWNAY